MFETLAENLEYVIFANPSMVLAGPCTQNWILFGSFFRHVFELPFAMFLGSHFDDFGLPMGAPVGSQTRFFGSHFLYSFWGPTRQRFWEGPAAGAEPV